MAVSNYTFLPWLRRGISNHLVTAAGEGASRATVSVALAVASEHARTDLPAVTIRLVGPGDVTGLDARQIIRVEPRAGVSDFEPNYLAAIDFYDEDFPWRYSPLAPDGDHHTLTPWITLVALEEREFTRRYVPDRPLPSFVLTAAARRADVFPMAGQEWAWAHAHINAPLGGTPSSPDLGALDVMLTANQDAGYARLLCPRRLAPNTAYTAFVIPVFETGRRSGLGETTLESDHGAARSWDGVADEFPVYFEWSFRTGVEGDFESLVRALVPRDMDPRVGIRDLDIASPGFGVDSVSNPPDDLVGLEGALLAPTTVRKGLQPASDFIPKIQPVLNAPAEVREAGDGDPLVAPPIYGCWHARIDRVGSTPSSAGWVDALNLDPRYRAAAGLGARVIRANQERYMRSAWDQIGDVLTVNRRIRHLQLATKAASALFLKSFVSLPPTRAVALASPTFSKILGSRTTLAALVNASRLGRAAVSRAFHAQIRPRGRFSRRLFAGVARPRPLSELIVGLNEGRLSAAPARPAVGGATLEAINEAVPSRAAASLLTARGLHPAAIAATESRPTFTYASARTDATLDLVGERPRRDSLVPGDNPAASDMRRALMEFGDRLSVTVDPLPAKAPVDLHGVRTKALAALEPHHALAARFAPLFRVGGIDALTLSRQYYVNLGRAGLSETLQEVMSHPDIKDAMYSPLQDMSSEYFLPNLKLIPNNTLSLLETNQPFIESYLTGLNHEFARELLWREYPTDQRGSSFRQFWDVSNFVDLENRSPQQLAEFLKDVPPMHHWQPPSPLGSHNHRQTDPNRRTVVLVIRGDLLKRYPNTFIYTQRAQWGTGVRANRLILSDETGELFTTAPNDPRLRFPLYKARIAPDLHFVGFDLTVDEVRGDPRLDETAASRAIVGDDIGWFFVIQEAVGEPRFGLDVEVPIEPAPEKWDNLSWPNIDLAGGAVIDLEKPFLSPPAGSNPTGVQWAANAADMAYVLYQDPAMVAVHGKHMLKNLTPIE